MFNYQLPVINPSDCKLSEIERKQLQPSLMYSFVNKNRDLKKTGETIASQTSPFVV